MVIGISNVNMNFITQLTISMSRTTNDVAMNILELCSDMDFWIHRSFGMGQVTESKKNDIQIK